MLLLLHSTFMLSVVKMLLKGEVGGCALNSHGNYFVDHGKSWKNHGIVILNFFGNPDYGKCCKIWITFQCQFSNKMYDIRAGIRKMSYSDLGDNCIQNFNLEKYII